MIKLYHFSFIKKEHNKTHALIVAHYAVKNAIDMVKKRCPTNNWEAGYLCTRFAEIDDVPKIHLESVFIDPNNVDVITEEVLRKIKKGILRNCHKDESPLDEYTSYEIFKMLFKGLKIK